MDTANVTERALPIGRVLEKRALLYVVLLVFAFALVLLLSTSNASATTIINADIAVDTQLDTSDDYLIAGDITVLAGVRLEIDPGVYINFTDGSSLTIEGYLYANGTLGNPIRMSSSTGTTPGAWEGILLTGPTGSRMVYFEINYAEDAIVVEDTSVTLSGTVNNAGGTAVSIVRTSGNLNVALTGLVVNSATDGYYFFAAAGNVVATVSNCAAFNVDETAVYAYSPNGNASVSVAGGLFSSPTAGMEEGVLASAYWNASVSVSGGAAFYFAQIGAYAYSDMANAAVTMNGVTLGNVEGAGTSYGAAAITFGNLGIASLSLTNMDISNATTGVFGWGIFGGVNIAVSGVTFENVTDTGIVAWAWELGAVVTVTNCDFNDTATAIYVQSNQTATITITGTDITNTDEAVMVENNFGGVNVVMNRVNITGITSYGVNIYSDEAGATVTMTDVSITGLGGSGSIYCDLNATATVTATRFYASGLMLGLSVETANGNVVLDVSTATIEYAMTGVYVFAPNGAINARIDPTLINHSLYGIYVAALGNIALTLVDVDMNDTYYSVYAYSALGNINFAWTNGVVTAEYGLSGVYLNANEGAVTAAMTNVDITLDDDSADWWSMGNPTTDGLYVYANTTATVSLTGVSFNYGWYGVSVSTNFGAISFTAAGLDVSNVLEGVVLSSASSLTIVASDLNMLNSDPSGVTGYFNYLPNTAFRGMAVGNVDATFNGFVTDMLSGIRLSSDVGNIDFALDGFARSTTYWTSIDMVYLDAPNGAATVDVGSFDAEMYPFMILNGYGLYVYANLSVVANIDGFDLTNATNGVSITSLIGDVTLDIMDATLTNNLENGILVYANEGAMSASFDTVVVNHTGNNGIVLQAMNDLDLAMTDTQVNDSGNYGVLVLSSMGNVVLDLTNVEVLGSGFLGMSVVAAMGTIDATIDPSFFVDDGDVGLYIDAGGAVSVTVTDTTFQGSLVGMEIHSQAGGIDVNLVNVQFLGNLEEGLFVEADADDVVVDCTGSLASENGVGFYLRTFLGDIYLNVDNTTFELGEYGIFGASSNDIFANLVDDELLGQGTGGVYLSADHDVVVTYLRDNFDGSLADDMQLFLPGVVDSEYMMIDPDVWTTNSWLTVTLDWGFEFNGVVYNQVTMSKNGWIGFGVTNVNGTTYNNFGPGVPNMIAACLDYNFNNNEYPGIGYKKVEGAIVFHWYVWQTGTEQLKNVFEIWLFESGDVEIRYAMMESKYAPSYPTNAYGVNFNGGANWDLRLWSGNVFYNDWMSVHFTMQRMSNGYASAVYAVGNITATVRQSSVSHWWTGGMLFECSDGILEVEITDTSFSYLGGFDWPWAGLSLIDDFGPMNVEVTELGFYYIMGLAIRMMDNPVNGGVSSMAITDCTFEQVVKSGVMWSTVDDGALTGAYSLTSTKTVARNLGIHAGMFDLNTAVDTTLATWSITATDVFEDNDITGNLDPWLAQMWGPIVPPVMGLPPAQFYSALYYYSEADGESSTAHDVSIMNNVMVDPPMYGYGMAGISDWIYYGGSGSIASNFNVDAQDNQVIDDYMGFAYGIFGMVQQTLSGTDAGSSADLMVNANYVENIMGLYGYAEYGLGIQAFQPVSEGLGTGTLEFNAYVVDNEVWGSSTGVYVWSEASVDNSWGATSSDVTVTVQGNDIFVYDDAVDVNIASSAKFSHYFPPYEVPVDAASDIAFAVDVSGNEIETYNDGIEVYVDNLAQEDSYGVFTSAVATSAGTIDVYQNYIENWYYDGTDISLWAFTTSSTGQASSTLDVDFSVLNNTIYAYGADGIYIDCGAWANTLDYRYADTASAISTTTVEIMGNQVWYADNAITVEEWADADGGQTDARLVTTVDVLNNAIVQAHIEGIYIDIYGDVNGNVIWWYGEPYASVNAVVTVSDNTVSGDGWTGESWAIDVEIYNDAENYEYLADIMGSALITRNTVNQAEGGIYFLSWPVAAIPVTITQNTVDSCEYGIEADMASFFIQDNLVTNSASEGISVYGGTGSILDNTVTCISDQESYGIIVEGWNYYLETIMPAYNVLVQDNQISDAGADGIWGAYVNGLTITDNTIQNCGWSGIWLGGGLDEFEYYLSQDLSIVNNQITNVGNNGIFVSYFEDISIMDNTIDGVANGYGIWVHESDDFEILDNVVSNAYGGLAITYSTDGYAENNVLSTMAVKDEDGGDEEQPESTPIFYYGIGIYVDHSDYIEIYNSPVTGFLNGVWVDDCYDVLFENIVVTMSVYYGGNFDDTSGLVIMDCVFSMSGGEGLFIADSSGVVMDTQVSNNFLNGMLVVGESSIDVYNGVYDNNGEYGLWFEAPVDWIVDEASEVVNNPVIFNGDLTVMNGGHLWLNLLMDFEITGDLSDGLAVIAVEAGGMLEAVDVDFYLDTNDSLTLSMNEFYEFNVYGGLEFMNVLVTDALELYLGPTSTVQIETSQIVYNLRNGVVVDGCAPVIMSSTIAMNNRNGLYVINGASPEITDCMIASNARGMYVRDGDTSEITDNVFALNSEAGVLVEQTTGAIHDNIFLLNNKEIYVKGGVLSIEDNQIGYSTLIDVIAQFAPLLGLMNMDESAYIPLLGIWITPETLSELLFGHIGVYATDGAVVSTSGNVFGMLTTGVMVVDSTLTFNDDIKTRTLMVPYMSSDGVIREMSLPVPVYDGIIAKNSEVTVNGGNFDVLDDAIFLDGSTASVMDAVLQAGDFSVYAVHASEATLTDVVAGKIKASDESVVTVGFALTVIVKDPWGATLANVPVGVKNAQGAMVQQGRTDSNGVFVAHVTSFVQTESGKDVSMNPYKVNASFGRVDTSGYPGHSAEFSPAEPDPTSVTVGGATSVVIQTNVIVKFFLTAMAADPNGKGVAGATVVLTSANGLYSYTGTTDANGQVTKLVNAYIQTPSGKDASAEPYSVTVTFPLNIEGYGGRVQFPSPVATGSAMVDSDMTQMVKNGIWVWYELTVTARDRFNQTAAGVYIVVTDALGVIAWDDDTGADGTVTHEVIGYTLSADGTYDGSMNPYKVTASFEKNPTPGEASVDMSMGSASIVVNEIVTEFNWTQALVIALFGALLLGVALLVISRKN